MGECGTSKQLVKYVSDTEEDESIVIEREQSEEVKSKKWEIFKSKLINSAEKKIHHRSYETKADYRGSQTK